MKGFSDDSNLTDFHNYMTEAQIKLRRKTIIVTLLTTVSVLVAVLIGVLVYLLVSKEKVTPPKPPEYAPKTLYHNKDIAKSLADERQKEIIKLENGLVATLISDPNIIQAGASLAVNVGSWQDSDVNGLANFAMRILSLGSKTFPEQRMLLDHLTRFKGNMNSFMSPLHTVFYFDILEPGFDAFLNMFSRLFNETLLPLEYVERKVNEIHSEFLINNGSDAKRKLHITGEFFGGQFETGNKDTLSKMAPQLLLDKAKAFISDYYYATNMNLALYSNKSISDLKAKAVKYFSSIANKTIRKPESKKSNSVDFHSYGNIGWFRTLTEAYKLNFIFPIPLQHFKQDLLLFFKYLLEDQDKGSFIYDSKESNHLISVSSTINKESTNHVEVQVELALTRKGMDSLDLLIRGFFIYLNTLREEIGELQKVFEENQVIQKQIFSLSSPLTVIQNVALNMNKMKGDFAYLFHSAPSSQATFNKTYIKEIFDYFVVDNCLLLIETNMNMFENLIQEYTDETMFFFTTIRHSSYYQTRYNIGSLTKVFVKELSSRVHPFRFKIRQANAFISKETVLIKCTDRDDACKMEKEDIKAEKIIQEEYSFIYYRLDRSFKSPKTFASFHIIHSGIRTHLPETYNQSLIFYEYYSDAIQIQLKNAIEAGNTIKMSTSGSGIILQVYAYNDVFERIIKTIFNLLRNPIIDEDQFKKYSQLTEIYKSQLNNDPPYLKAIKIAFSMQANNLKLSSIKELSVSLDQLNGIYANYANHYIIDCMFSSSLPRESISKVYKDSIADFAHASKEIAKELNVTTTKEMLEVLSAVYKPEGSYIYRLRPSKIEQNHGIVNLYYVCESSDQLGVIKSQLLHLAMNKAVTDVLKDQLQLGYVVQEELIAQGTKLFIRVCIQGRVQDPKSMDQAIDGVFKTVRRIIEETTEERLSELLSVILMRQPWTLQSKMTYLTFNAFARTLQTGDVNEANANEGITPQDLLELLDKITVDQVTKLSVQLYNSTLSIDMPMVNEEYSLNKEITSIVSSDLDMLKNAMKDNKVD